MLLLTNILIVVAFAVGNSYRVSLPIPGTYISILDMCIAILYVLGCSVRWRDTRETIKKYKSYLKAVIVFAVFGLVTLIVSGQQFGAQAQLVGLMYIVRWMSYACVVLVLPKKLSLYPIGITTVIIGLVQYLFLPDTRFIVNQQWDPHYYRVIGSLLDPGFTGIIIVIFLAWLINQKSRFKIPIWIISYTALALTYSRSSYLAYVMMVILVAYQKKSKSFFIKLMALGIVTLFILPRPGGEGVKLERSSTILARIQNWTNTLQIASKYPFIGTGFNTFRYAQQRQGVLVGADWQENHAGAGADASLLFILATTGILGVTLYIYYLYALGRFQNMLIILGPLLVHSFFLNSLFYPAVLFTLAVAISLSKVDSGQ